jgi:ribonuclease R
MLCANVATARFLEKLKLPALYRNHHGPKTEKLHKLRSFLKEKRLQLKGGHKPEPMHYDRLLKGLNGRADAGVIQSMMLRSLSQAEYSADNQGHFGLAYGAYAHFTSPIRRYPDLLVHRAIRSVIRGRESGGALRRAIKALTGLGADPVQRHADAEAPAPGHSYPYDTAAMTGLARHCSDLSRRADKASWDVDAWLKCDYMREAIGQRFDGVVTSVTQFGVFVELDNSKIEGLIHISALASAGFKIDSIKQSVSGKGKNKTAGLGDPVCVRVKQVDMEQKKIQFALVGFAE